MGELRRMGAVLRRPDTDPPGPKPCRECQTGIEAVWMPVGGKWLHPPACSVCVYTRHVVDGWKQREQAQRTFRSKFAADLLDGEKAEYVCPPGDEDARDKALAWTPHSGDGLFLHGSPGHGKTHLALGIARRWARARDAVRDPKAWGVEVEPEYREAVAERLTALYPQGTPYRSYRVVFVTASDALGRIRQTFNSRGESAEDVVAELKGVDVLVLDDLGTEKASGWAGEQFFRVLDHRVSVGMATVITSNLTLGDIAARYEDPDGFPMGERLASRIAGACQVVCVQGEGDYRLKGPNP